MSTHLLTARNVESADRAEMEGSPVARTAELMRLGRRMLELDASVTVASLRSIYLTALPTEQVVLRVALMSAPRTLSD